ncbi:hypothetical protein KY495_13105 [Massilia sp. PAMC28688]|uniref:DUF6708 domain-containing protein n=1 Tax=Massilia sp. PAMC28688 TaxID=2861283 RepID=UPI001C6257BA|nr:DUF6708 domain-containing protein [Massilia sp. PAMC28688]QYF91737.1 hypothetical protein KY495_13105 [Massilia sp. PAMC28688]
MEFTGLIAKYPVNRPLAEQERALQLHQKQALHVEPHYQLSVIQMNSTFLESVDKWFGWKGATTIFSLVALAMIIGTCAPIAAMWLLEGLGVLPSRLDTATLLAGSAGMAVIATLCALIFGWTLCRESFACTHYPIRFNRKARLVHVFRLNGTVLTAGWDQIFFTMGHLPQWNEWEVRGHILAADKVTVLETFPLSYVGEFDLQGVKAGRRLQQDFVRGHWEFIRRYMEDGPQAVSAQVQFCMPIDREKESLANSVERVFANIAGAPAALRWILWPWCLMVAIGRVFAMRTCKIPHFPADVEAVCRVDIDDPYAIRGDATGNRIPVFPAAAASAGVRFVQTQGRPR